MAGWLAPKVTSVFTPGTGSVEQIARILRPQLEDLDDLAQAEGDALAANLPRICVLTAYIKRRSNMELLRADGKLSVEELGAAITELAEAMRLCGVEAAVGPWGAGALDAEAVVCAYEYCFSLITDCLPDLRAFYALISGSDQESFELRLMLRTADLSQANIDCFPAAKVRPQIRVSIEEGDVVIVLHFAEGGA